MKKRYLLDTNRSCLTSREIQQFRQEITNQENSPVCKELSTMELVDIGARSMVSNKFCLVKGQLDV